MSWADVLSAALLASLATALIWRELHPKGVVVFVVLVILAEFFVQLRWRMGLACGACGFDPLLYSRQPEAAAQKVRDFFERRRERSDFLLTGQNLIETQRRIQTARRERTPRVRWPTTTAVASRPSGKSLSRTI